MRHRLLLRIHGRVQGVGFRAFVAREARSLALDGFVRNLPDGSVEVDAEGSREALERLLARAGEGPRWAQLSHVDARWEEPTSPAPGFHIRD